MNILVHDCKPMATLIESKVNPIIEYMPVTPETIKIIVASKFISNEPHTKLFSFIC